MKTISISNKNPLNNQLLLLTGDGWNSIAWTDTLPTGIITHRKTGIKVRVLTPEQEHTLSLFKPGELIEAGDLQHAPITIGSKGVAACLQGKTGFIVGEFKSHQSGRVYAVLTDEPWKAGTYGTPCHSVGLQAHQFTRRAV